MTWLPSPTEEADAQRRALEARVAAHLAELPGVLRASLVIADPPATIPRLDAPETAHPAVSAVVVLRPGASLPKLEGLIAAGIPGARTEDVRLVVSVESDPAQALVRVGPFQVAPASVAPLGGTLALALLVIGVLGFLLFRGERARAR